MDLRQELGEPWVTPPDSSRPRLVGNSSHSGAEFREQGGPFVVLSYRRVAGRSDVGDGLRSGVRPRQHLSVGDGVEEGRVVEEPHPAQDRDGAGAERDRQPSQRFARSGGTLAHTGRHTQCPPRLPSALRRRCTPSSATNRCRRSRGGCAATPAHSPHGRYRIPVRLTR